MRKKGPILYILCGLPFSGKTTLAKAIAGHTSARYVGFDELWAELNEILDPGMDKADEWEFIRRVAAKRIKKSLKKQISVVYDELNVRYEHRETLRDIARECGAYPIVVLCNTPSSLIAEREESNRNSQERHDVENKNFETAVAQFQKTTH